MRRWLLTREQDMWNGGLLRRVSEVGTELARARKRRSESTEQVERKRAQRCKENETL